LLYFTFLLKIKSVVNSHLSGLLEGPNPPDAKPAAREMKRKKNRPNRQTHPGNAKKTHTGSEFRYGQGRKKKHDRQPNTSDDQLDVKKEIYIVLKTKIMKSYFLSISTPILFFEDDK